MIDIQKIGIKKIIMTVFIIAIIFAFMVFAGLIKLGSQKNVASGKVVVWGTIPYNLMQPYIDEATSKYIEITYVVKDKLTYESDLINAFAAGVGPDLFIMQHENILRHADKIYEIPYASFPKSQYELTYIDGSKIFLTRTGILAIPMFVDPIVMYVNKPLIASSFLVGIPKYWDEVLGFVSKITISDSNGYVSISGASLGTYKNINHAKGIISAILLQNGNNIVGTNQMTGQKQSELTYTNDALEQAKQSLEFYVSFSKKENKNYSWNEAINNSRDKFISGELAIYFGTASEIEKISIKNPNLNFGVSLIPQINNTSIKKTYGSITAIAISKQTKNIAAAINAASKLSGKSISEKMTKQLYVSPVRYDLLKNKPNDEYLTVFYNSAIISQAWVDPDPDATNLLFQNLIRSINTGSLSISDALQRLNTDINLVLNRTINKTIKNKMIDLDETNLNY